MNRPLEHLRHLVYACIAFALLGAGIYLSLAAGLTPSPLLDQPAPSATVILGRVIGMVFILFGSLPVLLGVMGSALGIGWFLHDQLRPAGQNAVLVSLVTGLTMQWWIIWLLGSFGWFNFWTAWLLCAAGMAMLAWRLAGPTYRWLREVDRWPNPPWTLLPLLPALGILLAALCCPPGTLWNLEARGYDVLSYHLQLPREWMQTGRIAGLEHNVYSFLPNLMETGYYQLGIMHGSVYDAIYTAQILHASCAILTASAIGLMVRRLAGSTAGMLAAGLFMLMPWTLITASQAYNEMGAMTLASTALLVALDRPSMTWRSACIVGLLLGGTTMCKLTIGAMLVPPTMACLLGNFLPGSSSLLPNVNPTRPGKLSVGWRPFTMASLVLLVVLTPWLVRNTLSTNNPIFPLATNLLGRGHWDEWASKRWNKIHGPSGSLVDRVRLLNSRWFTNAGYGSVWGVKPAASDSTRSMWDIVRFTRSAGFPVLWTLAAAGLVLGFIHPPYRRINMLLAFMLGWCIFIWMVATHMQSRFLIPTLLPGCILASLALAWTDRPHFVPGRWLFPILVILVTLMLSLHQLEVLRSQSPPGFPLWSIADSLPRKDEPQTQIGQTLAGDHPLNHLTTQTDRTLLIADYASLLYIRRPFIYQSALDVNLLGQLLRQAGPHKRYDKVNQSLQQRGITHVWINYSELKRLHATYDFDPDVTTQNLAALVETWWPVWEVQHLGLYEIP